MQRGEADSSALRRGEQSKVSQNPALGIIASGTIHPLRGEADSSKQKFAIHKILVIAIEILCLFLI